MINLKLEIDKVLDFVNWEEIKGFQSEIDRHYQAILNKTGTGNDFLGWVDLPSRTDENLINTIEETARNIAENSEIHVVIGIGGSYLGARAVIEALQHSFSEFLKKED
ncbi:MAG: glucose-6-phosphate isomerase, partial [Bacteroidales bacterium]|nr:glucose-6-phosphate isomerase [Bacteroidales bacterium]